MTLSLRQRLLLATSVVYLAVAGCIALGVYVDVRDRLGRSLDDQLAQSAQVLLSLVASELYEYYASNRSPATSERLALSEVRAHLPTTHFPRELVFQLALGSERLLLRSHAAPATPLSPPAARGLSEITLDGRAWRVCTLHSEDGLIAVRAAEPLAARYDTARRFARDTLRLLALGAVLTLLLATLAIGFALRPLARLTRALDGRAPDTLAPLPLGAEPREVTVLATALNALLARLTRAFELERRFTADAAHELRTLLAGIRARAEVALTTTDGAVRRNAPQRITAAVDHAARLIEQLLTLARADAGAGAKGAEPVDLAVVLREGVAALARDGRCHHLTLELHARAAVPVSGRRDLLAAMVRNLLDNACVHAPTQGRVRCTVERSATMAVLSVCDDGPGIAAHERARLLRRFQRGATGMAAGVGLGLSIVARVAEVHGGSVSLDDAAGGGLRVEVHLPLATAADAPSV